jgi:transposase
MFHLHDKLKYFLYPAPVDMRKSFYTLSGIVTSLMKRDVQSGEVFIFVNRRLTTMKILHLEHGGLVIYHKKLESGVFKLPAFDENNFPSHAIGWHDLMMIVRDVKPKKRLLKRRQKEASFQLF